MKRFLETRTRKKVYIQHNNSKYTRYLVYNLHVRRSINSYILLNVHIIIMFDRPPSSKSFSKYIFTMLKRLANQQTTTSYMRVNIEIRIFLCSKDPFKIRFILSHTCNMWLCIGGKVYYTTVFNGTGQVWLVMLY